MDKLLFGVIVGTVVFILAVLADKYVRMINEGKPVIKWQKVIIPLVFLIIMSIIGELLIKISGY
jgi:DMSO reductase anchor subunit